MGQFDGSLIADDASQEAGKASAVSLQRIKDWFSSSKPSTLSEESCLSLWHLHSAQCRFLKTLPAGASVLDVGAGDGALHAYRDWPEPSRNDLKMYAFALDKGAGFDRYDDYTLGSWPTDLPDFGGRSFDAVNARNFIEHIDRPEDFVTWACGKLSPRGGIFLEWPRPESAFLPSVPDLAAFGLRVMTGNYYDDATHKQQVPRLRSIVDHLEKAGLAIESYGVARTVFLEDELLAYGKAQDDIVSMTLAYWSFTGWCQYLVARKREIAC